MLSAIEWESTVTLGGIVLGALAAAAGLLTYAYGARWKTAAQVNEANARAWEETAHRLDERIRALEAEHGNCRDQLNLLRARIVELEALPDLAAIQASLKEHDEQTSRIMIEHDQHAEIRAQKIIDALHELRTP